MSLASAGQPSWFGQPRGLTVLFLTEMWEKFSFYGMRAMLVYYMTKQLLMAQAQASLVYGLYTAVVYLTPIFGGLVADRWLGRRKAVILGGTIMAFGHFLMAFEPALYAALACIALGNGFFLPSLPSQIGGLYAPDDPRRVRAYNVYYVGVNLGGFLAPLVCGTIGELYGWHYGFGVAGIGMLAGLAIYILGRPYLPADPPRAAREGPARGRANMPLTMLLVGVGLSVVVFRAAYEQMGNTVALWADQGVDRVVGGGFEIPMTWFQSLNPLLVFALTPFLLAHWSRQAARGREPQPLSKMSLGAAGVAAAFVVLAAVSATGQSAASWLWLVGFFAVLTAGELFILPVGLGLFARFAPAGLAATAVAAWFLAAFAGNLLAGVLGTLWTVLGPPVFFALMGGVAGLSSLSLFALRPLAKTAGAVL
ncbi:peptide MFS transporter [Phenylobacterium sp. J426]|uniref:peptide MFS transporter n=1 Tax=Phenylobacterium sp. J426 TaxID=2898439 RepID=UPI0021518DCC|nr:peptide MFS transporter [Phenylobacterium sp. J426]MCR5876179.1 peptide MFS transporter [Phenylobacterium sp. J426]